MKLIFRAGACLPLVVLLSFSLAHASLQSPAVSANALMLYRNSNFHGQDLDLTNPDQERNGLSLQEAELQFYSDVDPSSRLSLLLSIHPELEGDGTKVEEKWLVEPEELFAESTALSDVTLKIGKFKGEFGKHNLMHTHAYPFVQAPLPHVKVFGDEGLNDVGVSAAWLLPASWFSEATFQYLRGQGENEEFQSPSPADGVGLLHLKNLFESAGSLTTEFGLSAAEGGNSFRGQTQIGGADLTFKWRPIEGGRDQSLAWTTEYLVRNRTQSGASDEKVAGVATWVQWQFASRWFALYRYDWVQVKDSFDVAVEPNDINERHSVALHFAASEFSSFKLEVDHRHGGGENSAGEANEKAIFLQANFTIGAHPSHAY